MIGEEQGHFWEKEILRIFIILVTTGFSRKVCSGFQLWKNEVFGQSNTWAYTFVKKLRFVYC